MYTLGDMPDLSHRLHHHDLGFLEIIAGFWGIDLQAPEARSALPVLTEAMQDQALVYELVEALPDEARKALDSLVHQAGWMVWSRFTHTYGELREVGPGKRDREKPFLDPVSATEVLWYRGLIGRDFLQRGGKLQECAYIPDDLLGLLPPVKPTGPVPPGRPASPGESKNIILASDRVLDHACTLLAALRLEDPHRSPAVSAWQPPYEVVHALLGAMKLITSSEQPVAEDARPFLEMARGDALAWLVRGWRESELFNELHLVPGLLCEGSWRNDPKLTREFIIDAVSEIPEGIWWHLDSFVGAIYEWEPDFQRPAGDYDTWLVRDAETGQSLSGFQHWDRVDGDLIHYLITGPMHWLGLVDLASPAPEKAVTAFRFSAWAPQLLLGKPATDLPAEDRLIEAFSDGHITANRYTPRLVRYQVSRFCLWLDETDETFTYLVTPASLSQAAQQGLKTSHLETLLRKYGQKLPPSLSQALDQWDKHGRQAYIHPCVILRVDTPEILQELRQSPAGRFLGDLLGPTAVIINSSAVDKVSAMLARLGYLSDVVMMDTQTPENHSDPELG